MKKISLLIVILCLTFGISGAGMTVQATEQTESQTEVTRIEWLKALTEAFQMEVKESNYPDNYYMDIDASSEDYHVVMLATEFGLVDVEAGEALQPNAAATREFAAHTMNLCMGYLLEEDVTYTFSESATVSYPGDIQIAIDKGWMELSGSDFLPQQGITVSEMQKMITAAKAAVASVEVDTDFENKYQFVEGVVVVPEGTEVVLTDENELTFYDSVAEISEGDIFVVFSDGYPVPRKAISISHKDDETVITVENVDAEAAFTSLEAQGTIGANLAQVQAVDDTVQLAYIVGGTEAQGYEDGVTFYSLEEVENEQEITAVIATKTIRPVSRMRSSSDDGMEPFNISCKITNVSADYGVSSANGEMFFKVSADVSVNVYAKFLDTPISSDFVESFVKIPIGVVGYFKPEVEGKINGTAGLVMKGNLTAGVQWNAGQGGRLIGNFKKESFTIEIKVEGKVGLRAAIGADVGFLKAELFAEAGVKASAKKTTYTDFLYPKECIHVTAHLYASAGGEVQFKLFIFKTKVTLEKEFINEKNSPVRVALHYDDGKPVSCCARDSISGDVGSGGSGNGSGSSGLMGGSLYKYYTPIDSQYAYGGANIGISSTGESYTIFEYSLDADNQATITKYNGKVAALNIPEEIDGYPVVGIGSGVFQNNSRLMMVNIPDTVEMIGSSAFQNCSDLSDVRLSKNLKSIGNIVFQNCDSLTSIEIPTSLEQIPTYAGFVSLCDNLKTIVFEEGRTKIPAYLFSNCTGLEEIVIPDTVTEIEDGAFDNCKNLKKVSIPSSVTIIGSSAFCGCSTLQEISIPDTVTEIGSVAFMGCINLSEVTLSKSLKTIGHSAFYACESLTRIEIPKSLETVTDSMGIFPYCDNLKTIVFEEGRTKIPAYLFRNSTGLEEIEIPDTVTEIESAAFAHCENLKKVSIPSSVKSIGSEAFSQCNGLQEIIIPDSVTEIGEWAFYDCCNLTEVTLSKNLKSIGQAFLDCVSLTRIEIPKSLEQCTSASGAFDGCDNLETILFEEGTTKIVKHLFANCTGLKEILIPDSVTEIENGAFTFCDNLKTVSIPFGVTKIGSDVFEYCSSLENINIPDSVMEIGSHAFNDCDSLKSVTIPDSVTTMGVGCFSDCELLSEVKLSNGLAKIDYYTFDSCPSLQKVVLPYDMTTVEANAFTNCTALTELTVPYGMTSIADGAFSYPEKMTVYGVAGTYAQEWASTVGATFVNRGNSVMDVKLNQSTLSMEAAQTYTLTANVYPDNAKDKTVTWSSSDETVATVNQDGMVTSLKKGTVKITATANDGSGVSGTCNVTVTNSCYYCTSVNELESPHNYENNCTDIWVYTLSGEKQIAVTFDERTNVEDELDFLYLYDGQGNSIGQYTGAELAGQTLIVGGDIIKIKLFSDSSGNAWGFKVANVEAYCEHTYATTWSCDEDYHWYAATCGHSTTKGKEKHTVSEWIVDKEATTEETGSRHKECTVCKRVLTTEEIDKLFDPVRDLEERLDTAVTQSVEAADGLKPDNYQQATMEEKQQAVATVLSRIETIYEEQDIAELEILSAKTAIEKLSGMATVEQQITTLLGTTVTVVEKQEMQSVELSAVKEIVSVVSSGDLISEPEAQAETQEEIRTGTWAETGQALPTVQNALLSVPAGTSATIQVARVQTPVIAEVDTTNAMAMTMELYSEQEEKLVLNAPVIITMPIPEGMDKEQKVFIYHFHEGSTEYDAKIPASLDKENNSISFVTDSFSTFVIVNAPLGADVSGTITSFGTTTDEVTVQLVDADNRTVSGTTVIGNNVEYLLSDVPQGTYTLQISKKNHVIRTYAVTMGERTVRQDGVILLKGDVTGDGRISSKDVKQIYSHSAGTSLLTDYSFMVGELTGDGRISSKDVKQIYSHSAGVSSLW